MCPLDVVQCVSSTLGLSIPQDSLTYFDSCVRICAFVREIVKNFLIVIPGDLPAGNDRIKVTTLILPVCTTASHLEIEISNRENCPGLS